MPSIIRDNVTIKIALPKLQYSLFVNNVTGPHECKA